MKMKTGTGFERLDQKYLDNLVSRAMKEDSNAFAELFAAVGDRQLYYLTQLYADRETAVDRLREVFTRVLREFPLPGDPRLFMAWVCRLSSDRFYEDSPRSRLEAGPYSLPQLLNLPLLESQIMLMHAKQGMTVAQICDILNLSKGSVRRFIKAARRRLQNEDSPAGQSSMPPRRRVVPADLMSEHETSQILETIFEACGTEANTIPVESLAAYAIYRKERFAVQRGILTAALILFMLLPACFIMPAFSLDRGEEGVRDLPVYDVSVHSLLPVGKVVATIRDIDLPVYEAGAKEYTVEPTGNGRMTVTVELINHQKQIRQADVSGMDDQPPVLTGNTAGGKTITIRAEDSGVGIDYHSVRAENAAGERITPLKADEKNGIVFEYPRENWDIYIPDHLGNTLHLNLKLN